MTDPRRLAEEGDELERSLLAHWQSERPSPEARAKLLAMVGVAASTATVAGAAATGLTTAGASVAPKAAGGAGLLVAKWLTVGVVALGAAAATVASTRRDAPLRPAPATPTGTPTLTAVAPAVTVVAPAVTTATAAPVTVPPEGNVEPTAAALPARLGAPASAPVKAAPPEVVAKRREPPVPPSTMAEQLAMIDRARAAIQGGDTSRGLELVDEYDARFPSGAFTQESAVLRIESLVQRGDAVSASRLGARFLAAHPDSPHAGHVRALLQNRRSDAP